MNRTIALAVLLFSALFVLPAFADPHYLYREPVRWRIARAATVGVFTDSVTFNSDGTSASDTTAAIDLRCLRSNLAGASVADSTIWVRLTLFRVAGAHAGGWAATPNVLLQTLSTPTTLGAAVASSATVPRLAAQGGVDSVYTIGYSAGAIAALANGALNAAYVRFIVVSTTVRGEFGGFVDYLTACPSLMR